MKVHFCRSNTLGGWLIRLFTFSNWNHVAIEVGGNVYEALATKGVIKTPAHRYGTWDEMKTVEVDVPNRTKAIVFLDQQVGKKYDWLALIALPFRTTWQSPHKWFCSELGAKALSCGGKPFRFPFYRVTPAHLYFGLSDLAQ